MQETTSKKLAPSRGQARRTRKALDLLQEHSWLLPQEGWVQLRSRSGDALAAAERQGMLRSGSAWGIDNGWWADVARSRYPDVAEWIAANPKQAPLPDGEAGLVMLLDRINNLSAALREMRRLARKNAMVLLALPSAEENGGIEHSLRKVYEDHEDWQAIDMPDDPLQRWNLREVIERGEHFGLVPFWAATLYEPVGYSTPHARLEEIEDDGHSEWLRFFEEEKRADAWREIREDWLQGHRPNTHRHNSFSSYIIFRAS